MLCQNFNRNGSGYMSAQTLTKVSVEDLVEGSLVDLQDDYIADPDGDEEFDNLCTVESVEQETDYSVYITFLINDEEQGFSFPLGHTLKVIADD